MNSRSLLLAASILLLSNSSDFVQIGHALPKLRTDRPEELEIPPSHGRRRIHDDERASEEIGAGPVRMQPVPPSRRRGHLVPTSGRGTAAFKILEGLASRALQCYRCIEEADRLKRLPPAILPPARSYWSQREQMFSAIREASRSDPTIALKLRSTALSDPTAMKQLAADKSVAALVTRYRSAYPPPAGTLETERHTLDNLVRAAFQMP